MERKVGEIFEDNGEWYQCVECDSCGKCSLRTTECGSGTKSDIVDEVFGECSKVRRTDNKHAIFKKLKKVGEPEIINGKKVQSIVTGYVGCAFCIFKKGGACLSGGTCKNRGTGTIYVEVKQNKENIEEREYSEEDMKNNPRFKHHKNIEQVINMQKMKPFDLEAAKAGKPVCTRDGRKVRIISFDRKFLFKGVSYPIIALVEDTAKEETIYGYNEKGKVIIENDTPYKDDLMMLPQKKEGWVRIYKSASNVYYLSSNIYKTEEEAKHSSDCCYVGASKISWEE